MSIAILGLAAYPENKLWENVSRFIKSARRNSSRSELLLITPRLGSAERDLLDSFNVRSFELVDSAPFYDKSTIRGREDFLCWLKSLWINRHNYYLKVIDSIENTHIMLTDTRDVIVTGDLDPKKTMNKLVISQEDVTRNISSESNNRDWIARAYGDYGLCHVGAKPILCAGTVFGPLVQIKRYVIAMQSEIQRIGYDLATEVGDQPLHNYLGYSGLLPAYEVSSAEDGWIKSIGIMNYENVKLDWCYPRLSWRTRRQTLVCHQYDRHIRHRSMRYAVRLACGEIWGMR